ncbi:MAG: aspartyl-phosphate phosphatase Spo0E family protein [Firmicutes bacterium]|nr:aspartyl-phosphate phosphatase Spo0E family protein [Bacillota bacterium]
MWSGQPKAQAAYLDRIEYLRGRLMASVEQYGDLQHPEVLRLSRILDRFVILAVSHDSSGRVSICAV